MSQYQNYRGILLKVDEKCSSLDSSDVFILETPSKTWVWSGQGSVEEETEQAVRLSGVVSPGREMVMVKEGEEEDEFWEALGGKTEYNNSDDINKPILHPRSLLKNTILNLITILKVVPCCCSSIRQH